MASFLNQFQNRAYSSPTNSRSHRKKSSISPENIPITETSMTLSSCSAGNKISWNNEIGILMRTKSHIEALSSLYTIMELLEEISEKSSLKLMKVDFEVAVQCLHEHNTEDYDILKAISNIFTSYFNKNYFLKLPISVIEEIFVWLPVDDFAPISPTCKEWHELGTSDQIWSNFYKYKFLRSNPGSLPVIEQGKYMNAFHNRLNDPHIGDKVEVAWRGKFRLEALDVYQGLAWWVAEVVDKHSVKANIR